MIKAILFLTLLAVSNAADTTICAKVICGSPTGDNTCASYKDNTYTIKPCTKSGELCNIESFPAGGGASGNMTCVTATTPAKPEKKTGQIAGSACTEKSNCAVDCSGNVCTGLSSGAKECVTVSSALGTGDKSKVCGASLYCDSKAVCSSGIALGDTCKSGSMPCIYPNICGSDSKCVAIGSAAKGKSCVSSSECATDLYCNDGTCADALPYSKGSVYGPCSAAGDCSGDCNCTITNTEGKGQCQPLGNYGSKDLVNSARDHQKNSTTKCPLNYQVAPSCTTPFKLPFGSFSYGSCYSSFRFGTANTPGAVIATTSSNSSVQIVLSFFTFLFFLF